MNLQEIARLVREELLTLIRPVQLLSVNPSKSTGEVSGRFRSNGVLFDYSIGGGTVRYRPVGAGDDRSDSADQEVWAGPRLDAASRKPRNCTTGYACGATCIQKGKTCKAKGGAAAEKVTAIVKYAGGQQAKVAPGRQEPAAVRPSKGGNERQEDTIDTEISRLQKRQKQASEHAMRSGHHSDVMPNAVIAGLQALKNKKDGKPLRWEIHNKTYQIPEAKLRGLSPREITAEIYTRVFGKKPSRGQAYFDWFAVPGTASKTPKPAAAGKTPSGAGKGPSLAEARSEVLAYFRVKSVAGLKRNKNFQQSMAGDPENPLQSKEDWLKLYRRFIRVPANERNLPDGPTVINGIDVIKNFRPWVVFGLDPKTATADEVRASFRKLLIKHHPDQGGDPRMPERLKTMRDSLLAFMPDSRKAGRRKDSADADLAELLKELTLSRLALRNRWSAARRDGYREALERSA